jgi:hypothetical protein
MHGIVASLVQHTRIVLMREFRPVAPAEAADADMRASGAGVPDDGLSAMDALAKAAEISRPGVAPRSRRASTAGQVNRIDLSGLNSAPPLHPSSLTGAAAGGRPGDHVGGAMLPPPVNTVALSDGTRISFGAVQEVPVHEYA